MMDTRKPCGMEADLVQEYLDGELRGPRRDQVASHLESCSDCARELQEYRRLSERLAFMPLFAPDADFDRAVLSAVLPARGRVLGLSPLGWFATGYVVFTFGLLAAAVVYLVPPAGPTPADYFGQLWSGVLHTGLRAADALGVTAGVARHVFDALAGLVVNIGFAGRLAGEAAKTYDGALYMALAAVTAFGFFRFARRTSKGGPIVHAAL